MQSTSTMNIDRNLVEIILDEFKYLFQLLSGCLSKKLLAEEVCYLMHHKLVERAVFRA